MEDRPAFHSRKPWLPLLVTLALMAGLGGWIGWQWHAQESRTRIEQEQRFTFAVDDIEQTLRARMRAYEMVLRGMEQVVRMLVPVLQDAEARRARAERARAYQPR